MRKYFVFELFFLFYLLLPYSCETEDMDPDQISNEIKVSCQLTTLVFAHFIDTTSSKEVWISSGITKGCSDRQFNSIGQCWSFNTEILPTFKTEKNEVPWAEVYKSPFRVTKKGIDLYSFNPITTGIPVSESDTMLIVRGYVIFNDTLIRYSDPLVLNNPNQYAN